MEGAVTKLIYSVLNAILLAVLILGLSKQEVWVIAFFACCYGLIGFVLSITIPPFLYRRGIVTKRERDYIANGLSIAWFVVLIAIVPKLYSALVR